MARSGEDPHAAIAFWQRMVAAQQDQQSPQLASDHPSHENRIAALEGRMSQAEAEYHAFQERLCAR